MASQPKLRKAVARTRRLKLFGSVDAQAFIGEAAAQRGRIALQSRIRDMASVNPSVPVSPTQPFPPITPIRIAASTDHFSGSCWPPAGARLASATASMIETSQPSPWMMRAG